MSHAPVVIREARSGSVARPWAPARRIGLHSAIGRKVYVERSRATRPAIRASRKAPAQSCPPGRPHLAAFRQPKPFQKLRLGGRAALDFCNLPVVITDSS